MGNGEAAHSLRKQRGDIQRGSGAQAGDGADSAGRRAGSGPPAVCCWHGRHLPWGRGGPSGCSPGITGEDKRQGQLAEDSGLRLSLFDMGPSGSFLQGHLCVPVQERLDSTKSHCWVYRVLLSKTTVVLTKRLSLDLRIMG